MRSFFFASISLVLVAGCPADDGTDTPGEDAGLPGEDGGPIGVDGGPPETDGGPLECDPGFESAQRAAWLRLPRSVACER